MHDVFREALPDMNVHIIKFICRAVPTLAMEREARDLTSYTGNDYRCLNHIAGYGPSVHYCGAGRGEWISCHFANGKKVSVADMA